MEFKNNVYLPIAIRAKHAKYLKRKFNRIYQKDNPRFMEISNSKYENRPRLQRPTSHYAPHGESIKPFK